LLAPFLRSLEQEIAALLRLRSTALPMNAITLRAPQIGLDDLRQMRRTKKGERVSNS